MKTQEEMNALKEEVVTLNEKLHELTEEELAQVTGGIDPDHISTARYENLDDFIENTIVKLAGAPL